MIRISFNPKIQRWELWVNESLKGDYSFFHDAWNESEKYSIQDN